MEFNVQQLERTNLYQLLVGCILPRPIAWVSTQDMKGVCNLAPFSFFNVMSVTPPLLGISILKQASERDKDTLANIRLTGELVVNIVNLPLAEAMNVTCGAYASDVDEFELAGLARATSVTVKPPGVAEAPVRLECTLHQCLSFGHGSGAGNLVLAEVKYIHVADEVWRDGAVDDLALQAVGKLGGDRYSLAEPAFSLARPV
ncbi:flavin reductase family protein (plasmid) [Chromobacterium amazonense]|uniref:flavin reductase family protein n=1 Tax=Chromobacterium amazonense TaxID=1382803 RepID=UPI00237DB210|nr:flavin reductase family protein [Chromobacterium amazonense]MDE1714363.1 flavin reductase family protein [Chromobacterium amazonense]